MIDSSISGFTSDSDHDVPDNEALATEVAELQRANQRMKDGYDSLNSQFQEAVLVSNKITDVCEQNSLLSKKNREMQATIDELTRRLEISFHLNDELNEKIEREKETTDAFVHGEADKLRQEIDRQERASDEQRKEAAAELESVSAERRALEREKNQIMEAVDGLLRVASRKFDNRFRNVRSLSDFLEQASLSDQMDTSEKPPQGQLQSMDIAKMKRKMKEVSGAKKGLEAQIESLKAEMKSIQKEKDIEVAKSAAAFSAVQAEQNALEAELEKQANSFQYEKKQLEERVMDGKEKSRLLAEKLEAYVAQNAEKMDGHNEEVIRLRETVVEMSGSLKRAGRVSKKAKKTISALEDKINEREAAQNELVGVTDVLVAKNKKLMTRLSECEQTNEQMVEENEEMCGKSELLTNELTAANQKLVRAKAIVSSLKSEAARLKSAISGQEKIIEEQSAQVLELSDIKRRQEVVISEQEATISHEASHVSALTDEVNKLREDVAKMEVKQQHSPSDVPVSTWFCGDFPKDLCVAVAELGKCDGLHNASKLRKAFSMISRHYDNAISQAKAASGAQLTVAEKTMTVLRSIVNIINTHIGTPPIQAEALLKDGSLMQSLEKRLNDIREDHEIAVDAKAKMTEDIKTIYKLLGVTDLRNVGQKIDEMTATANGQVAQIKKLRSGMKQLKAERDVTVNEMRRYQAEFEDCLADKDRELDELTAAKAEQVRETNIHRQHTKDLENALKRMSSEHDEARSSIREENKGEVAIVRQGLDAEYKRRMEAAEQAHQQQLDRLCGDLKRSNEKYRKLKRSMQQVISNNEELTRALEHIEYESAETVRASQEEALAEIKRVDGQHRSEMAEIQATVENKEERMQEMAKELVKERKQVKTIGGLLKQAEDEKKQLALRIDSHKAAIEREQRLSETKIKAFSATTEMKTREHIDEITARFDAEMRGIFHFGVGLFRQFFDPRQQLCDSSYRKVLQSVKAELTKMQSRTDTQNKSTAL